MSWREYSILRNSDNDFDKYLESTGGYSKPDPLFKLLGETTSTENRNHFYSEEESPCKPTADFKVDNLKTRPSKRPSNSKLTQAELCKKLVKSIEFYTFNGTLYVYDSLLFTPCDRKQIARLLEKILLPSEYDALSANDFRGIYTYLTEYTFNIPSMEELPIIPGYVLFKNGPYNVISEKPLPNSTRFLCFHQIQANYDPNYCYEDTPIFDQFLEDISGGDQEIKDRIWEAFGYLMTHDPGAKIFIVMGTAGNSGKSQLINFLERLIGTEHVSHVDPQRLAGRFSLGPLMGKSLNTAADLSAEPISPDAVSQLKRLTGGDFIPIEHKFETPSSMFSVTKLLFATNHPLKIRQDDPAAFDRMLVIPFLYSTPRENQNKQLVAQLWEEKDAIVSKAMKAYRNLVLHNYQFSYCCQADAMKESWISGCFSNVHNFIKDRCDRTDLTAKTSTQELYNAYLDYCTKKELIHESENAFSRAVTKEFSLKSVRVNKRRGFQGIKLKKESNSKIWVGSPDNEFKIYE